MPDTTLEHIASALWHMSQSRDPVSFYDALLLVRQLPRGIDLPDALLHGLLSVHDGATTTDGAREILAEFLRAYANRLAQERELGNTPITLKHSGKRARVRVAQSVLLKLDERRGAGYSWELVSLDGPAACQRRADSSTGPVVAEIIIVPRAKGVVRIHLREQPLAVAGSPWSSRPAAAPRTFSLEIVVD